MGMHDSSIANYLHSMSLDGGPDEECGSATEGDGWYGLMQFATSPVAPTDEDIAEFELSDEDVESIREVAGAILFTDTQGFQDATLYEDADSLESAWQEVLDAEPTDEDEDEDEPTAGHEDEDDNHEDEDN